MLKAVIFLTGINSSSSSNSKNNKKKKSNYHLLHSPCQIKDIEVLKGEALIRKTTKRIDSNTLENRWNVI